MDSVLTCFGENIKIMSDGDLSSIISRLGVARALLFQARNVQARNVQVSKVTNFIRLGPIIYNDGSSIEVVLNGKYGWVYITSGIQERKEEKNPRYKLFLCHPRTFNGKGWDKKGNEISSGPYVYPLIDGDGGTRGLYKRLAWKVYTEPEDYGNLDWVGENGGVVSWRGPVGRQLPMDSIYPFPGFTEWDYTEANGPFEVEHFTPYRNLVYRNGKVAYEFLYGYKVLGAALNGDKIISVVGVDYAGRTNPEGGTGGFYNEVWLDKELIGFSEGSSPSTPWFFNSTGTEAINSNKKVSIGRNNICSFSDLEPGSGTQINEYTGEDRGTWGVTKSGSWPVCRDFSGLIEQHLDLSIDYNENSELTSYGTDTYADLQVMISGEDNPTVTINGPEAYGGEEAYSYTVIGNHCGIDHVDWTFPTGCGMGTVTVVVTFTGGSSITDSMAVRMPTGVWIDDGVEYWDTDTSYSGIYTEIIAG
jgi:hypothetical protein